MQTYLVAPKKNLQFVSDKQRKHIEQNVNVQIAMRVKHPSDLGSIDRWK